MIGSKALLRRSCTWFVLYHYVSDFHAQPKSRRIIPLLGSSKQSPRSKPLLLLPSVTSLYAIAGYAQLAAAEVCRFERTSSLPHLSTVHPYPPPPVTQPPMFVPQAPQHRPPSEGCCAGSMRPYCISACTPSKPNLCSACLLIDVVFHQICHLQGPFCLSLRYLDCTTTVSILISNLSRIKCLSFSPPGFTTFDSTNKSFQNKGESILLFWLLTAKANWRFHACVELYPRNLSPRLWYHLACAGRRLAGTRLRPLGFNRRLTGFFLTTKVTLQCPCGWSFALAVPPAIQDVSTHFLGIWVFGSLSTLVGFLDSWSNEIVLIRCLRNPERVTQMVAPPSTASYLPWTVSKINSSPSLVSQGNPRIFPTFQKLWQCPVQTQKLIQHKWRDLSILPW